MDQGSHAGCLRGEASARSGDLVDVAGVGKTSCGDGLHENRVFEIGSTLIDHWLICAHEGP
jgi:hypothetical protein